MTKNLPAMQEITCNTGNQGSIPRLGRFPGEENGNPLQYSCLKNPTDRGAWWATVHAVARVRHNLVTKPHTQTTHTYFPPVPPSHSRSSECQAELSVLYSNVYLIVYTCQHYFLNSSHPYLPLSTSPFSRPVSPFLPCK